MLSKVKPEKLVVEKTCPAVLIPYTTAVDGFAGLVNSTTWQFQIITCTKGTFPSGLNYQGFICNVFSGLWSPDPAKNACNGGGGATNGTGS